MNTIEKTAFKETAKTLAGLTLIGIAVPAAIFLIPLEVLGGIFSVAALCFAAKMIYDTKLAQAKFDAEINKTVDQ
jgi:uncharacterized membrane protein YfcA